MKNLIDTLTERGLISQMTDKDMQKRFETQQTVYCGFDPTADSLHIGSLIPLIAMIHCGMHGHDVKGLVGDATAMIGDPSGKSVGRNILDEETVDHNTREVENQMYTLWGNGLDYLNHNARFEVFNNLKWFEKKSFIEILREVGSKMSVNKMLTMDSVKNRIDSEQGISFLEFSYMTMQAFDFLHLAREQKVTVQIGGQDQWGNIIMGIELARKSDGLDLAGITLPLVTKSDGTKFGKSESGNIWLDEKKTSVFDFYQFWRNIKDEDVEKFMKMFTFMSLEDIDVLVKSNINIAKAKLACEVTCLVHGKEKADKAFLDASALFSGGKVFDGIPSKKITTEQSVVELLVSSEIATSKTDARRKIESGGVKINGDKVSEQYVAFVIPHGDVVIQYGKKAFKFTS